MSQKYYIVVNDQDLPCDSMGQTVVNPTWEDRRFPGAYAYSTLREAEEAALKFTQKTQESHAVYGIPSRFVYQPKVVKQEFT